MQQEIVCISIVVRWWRQGRTEEYHKIISSKKAAPLGLVVAVLLHDLMVSRSNNHQQT